MELELREINVTLSNDQKQEIRNAFINSEKIRLRLSKDNFIGCDTLLVPTRFFEETDNQDGINAVVDEQTEKEIREEFEKYIDEIRENLKNNYTDEILEAPINREIMEKSKKYRDKIQEVLKNDHSDKFWTYYGLFFNPAIDESLENKGIEFDLDYSLLNDLAKDFIKNNIKNLFY